MFWFTGISQAEVDKKVREAKSEERKSNDVLINNLREERRTMEQDFNHEVKDLKKDHELKLKEKEFEIKHLADERVKKAEEDVVKMREELSVAKKENEMLGKITDLNADVIDVKKLVSDLINKLPNVNITAGIATGGGGKQEKKD